VTKDQRNAATAAKLQFRRAARAGIAAMTAEERERADVAVSRCLVELAHRLHAAFVVAYLALPDEVRLEAFLEHMAGEGIPALVPRVAVKGKIDLAVWTPGCALGADLEGVPSPEETTRWPEGRGLLVVPGRVFDTEGGRVGRGLGYYDRFLVSGRQRGEVAGAAYACQIVDRVPREPHDVAVDWVVTERGSRRAERVSVGE
jgi:5-formyltetrahydrofolate cyclo-ligase